MFKIKGDKMKKILLLVFMIIFIFGCTNDDMSGKAIGELFADRSYVMTTIDGDILSQVNNVIGGGDTVATDQVNANSKYLIILQSDSPEKNLIEKGINFPTSGTQV